MKKGKSKGTICVHSGTIKDEIYGGAISPLYESTAYSYEEGITRYPRYFNLPNQLAVEKKIAALENTEEGMVFSSGLAAVMTVFFTYLKTNDHIVLQENIYGGTYDAVINEFEKFGIEYTFSGSEVEELKSHIKKNTKMLFIETPSNPLLSLTDVKSVAELCSKNNIISVIDNTFASPINQNPAQLGIDITIHSGTKYLGGHSDICCGAVALSSAEKEKVLETAVHFGGSLDVRTCALLERSLKTLEIRVQRQTENALIIAIALEKHPKINKVYYPGLPSHPQHQLAMDQMHGFGAMLSFEIPGDTSQYVSRLQMVSPVVSLGAVETTISSPVKTSHARLDEKKRLELGISSNLLRLSVGIENAQDIIDDLLQAIE